MLREENWFHSVKRQALRIWQYLTFVSRCKMSKDSVYKKKQQNRTFMTSRVIIRFSFIGIDQSFALTEAFRSKWSSKWSISLEAFRFHEHFASALRLSKAFLKKRVFLPMGPRHMSHGCDVSHPTHTRMKHNRRYGPHSEYLYSDSGYEYSEAGILLYSALHIYRYYSYHSFHIHGIWSGVIGMEV